MTSTAEFLRHILPREGFYAAFVLETKRHIWTADLDELGAAVLSADADGQTVYHACASFKEPTKRRKDNALAARSFWLDIDVAPKSRYADALEAYQDVERFCGAVGFPRPLYVGSGNGLHCYWPLADSLDPDTWGRYAGALKRLCADQQLDAGAERTADIASILRPVGSHHRKTTPRLVECSTLVGPYRIEQFERLRHDAGRTQRSDRAKPSGLAGALANTFADEPRFAGPVADSCAQLGAMRRTGGRLAEPLWYACLGVLTFCADGEQFAHEWSSGDERYTAKSTADRLERAKSLTGATTCEHFHGLNPKLCEGCPHWGKIKSPIGLGRSEIYTQTAETPPKTKPDATTLNPFGRSGNEGALEASGSSEFSSKSTAEQTVSRITLNPFGEKIEMQAETQTEAGPALPLDELPELPHDFFWRKDGALITRTDSGRGTVDIVVSRYPIFLGSVQTGEARGEFTLVFRQRLPERGWLDIVLGAKAVFSSASASEFADRGANIHEHQHFIRYVRGAIDLFHASKRLAMRYDQFGWKNDDKAFLYGLDLYTAEGQQRVVGNDELQVRCREDWIGPCKHGDIDAWKRAINALFAVGCEPQSVALLGAFAAPLMRFQERDEGGAIIHLVTRESGTGKSTALVGAASVWGRREGLGLTNDDTRVSKALTLGALGNLPVIYDEIAIRDPDAIRSFVVGFTNGRDKMRATRGGDIKHTASTWQTILISAANTSLVDVLSLQNTPEAPAYRILELPLAIPLDMRHAQGDRLRRILRNNSGHAGAIYLRWLLQPDNLRWVQTMLERTTKQVWERTKWTSDARFWVRTIAAIAVAGVVVKQLDLVDFSIDRILDWLLTTMISHRAEKNSPNFAVSTLAEYLNEHIGNTLVMPGAFVAGKHDRPILVPRLRVTIRFEIASNRYLIATGPLRDWMARREMNFTETVNALEKMQVVVRKKLMATLGAGSDTPGGQTWCVEVNGAHEAIRGTVDKAVLMDNNVVVAMKR